MKEKEEEEMNVEEMEVDDKEGKRDDKRRGGCKELTNSRKLVNVYTILSILLV